MYNKVLQRTGYRQPLSLVVRLYRNGEVNMSYDRSIKIFDEAHAPVLLDKMVNEKDINKGKFLSKAHAESYLCQMQTKKCTLFSGQVA